MASKIEKVVMKRSGCRPVALATSGVDACVTVVVLLRGDDVFISHVDPTRLFERSSSMDVAGWDFIEHCVVQLYGKKPGVAIDAVFLIGGRDTSSYHQLSQWIDRVRGSPYLIAWSKKSTVDNVHDSVRKIKLNLLTLNIRRRRATSNAREEEQEDDDGNGSDLADDYVSDCAVVFDRTSIPTMFIIAQRAGMDRELNGDAPLTPPFVIYKVDVTSSRVSATTYPPLYESPFSSVLVETVRRNVPERLCVMHRVFDLSDDDEHKILLSRVEWPRSHDSNDEC